MFSMYHTIRKQGFTLIEMLIVVAIIGVLASIVLVGLGPVQRRGRDARRIADLRETQNALELYFGKCTYYPGGVESGETCSGRIGSPANWQGVQSALTGSNLGINQIPSDPSIGRSYVYASDGSGYILGALFEDTANPALQGDYDGQIPSGYSGAPAGFSCQNAYCIRF